MDSYVHGFIGSYADVSGLLRLEVLTFRGFFVTSKGFYIQGFLPQEVLTSRGSHVQGFLHPGALTSKGSYIQGFLLPGVLTSRGSYV